MSKELLDRFLCYVKKETRSDEKSTTVPSTKSQIKFQEELVEELKALKGKDNMLDNMLDELLAIASRGNLVC